MPKIYRVMNEADGKPTIGNVAPGMGEGSFVAGVVSLGLHFRPDPTNSKHGFVEPDTAMPTAEYQKALTATQGAWRVDEAG